MFASVESESIKDSQRVNNGGGESRREQFSMDTNLKDN